MKLLVNFQGGLVNEKNGLDIAYKIAKPLQIQD